MIHVKETIKWLLILSLPLLLNACASAEEQTYEEQAVSADFITIRPTNSVLVKHYPGNIEGNINVDIKAQVSGYLETTYIQEGDYVTKNQPLFKIKGAIFNEQVAANEANLQAALANQKSARIELEKIKPLVEGKVVSDFQRQTAQANYDAATAMVMQAKSAIKTSQLTAEFTLIRAPVSGYIGRIPKRKGNLITPEEIMTTLSEINSVFVYFAMSEADFISYSKNKLHDSRLNTVSIELADGSIYDLNGKLDEASGHIDPLTGTMAMKAIFANPSKILRSGGSARVILTNSQPESLTVPMASVKDIQDKFFVYLLTKEQKVRMVPIEIKGNDGLNYIVKSGLRAGDQIAINSIDALNDGSLILANPTTTTTTNP